MKALIIQGNIIPECIDKYIELYYNSFDEIIISSYPHDHLNTIQNRLLDKIKVVYNSRECNGYYNFQNLYYHALNTLNGLKESKSDYCLKVRGDEFYSNLDKYDYNRSKMFVNNTFFSPNVKYHISDHIIGTDREIFTKFMQIIVDKCMDNTYKYPDNINFYGGAEVTMFKEYLNVINADPTPEWKDLINTHIDISYVEDLEPLRVTFNSAGLVYRSANDYYNSPSIACDATRGVMRKPARYHQRFQMMG